jgi:hypothetical protein
MLMMLSSGVERGEKVEEGKVPATTGTGRGSWRGCVRGVKAL